MGQERELKFRADPEKLAALAADFGDFTEISMETTYYDTLGGALSKAHITLRRRLENGVSVCTVKTPEKAGVRGEWETEAESVEQAIPVLCKLGCRQPLVELTASGVVPVCGARFTRRAAQIKTEAFTAELALDQGVLLGGEKELPLCEVELELKSGSWAALVAYGARLQLRYGLQEETKSKFRRALNLAKGEK